MLLRPFLLTTLLAPSALLAQGERILLRTTPAPNQTIRVVMTQDLLFDIEMEVAGGTGPTRMVGRINFSGTQQVGAPDREGRVTAQLTTDEMSINMTLNGNAAPSPPDQMKGKVFTIVYDSAGKVLEVNGPPELGASGASAKDMITALSRALPSGQLAVGDTVTLPVSIPVPIPIPGNAPAQIGTRVTSKLVAIGREGGDRLASLEQTTVGEGSIPMEVPGPSGPISATMEMRMTGTGTLQLNVDKGFVKAGSSDLKMDMTMLMQGMSMKMTGTVHMVITGETLPPG